MFYENFKNYPLKIHGITEASENHLLAIKEQFLKDLKYSGDVSEVEDVIPYFVFYLFLHDAETNASVGVGETRQKRDESTQDYQLAVNSWNLGVESLSKILEDKETSCNPHFISPIKFY